MSSGPLRQSSQRGRVHQPAARFQPLSTTPPVPSINASPTHNPNFFSSDLISSSSRPQVCPTDSGGTIGVSLQAPGTKHTTWAPTTVIEPPDPDGRPQRPQYFHSISAMDQFKKCSAEELRVQDQAASKKAASKAPSAAAPTSAPTPSQFSYTFAPTASTPPLQFSNSPAPKMPAFKFSPAPSASLATPPQPVPGATSPKPPAATHSKPAPPPAASPAKASPLPLAFQAPLASPLAPQSPAATSPPDSATSDSGSIEISYQAPPLENLDSTWSRSSVDDGKAMRTDNTKQQSVGIATSDYGHLSGQLNGLINDLRSAGASGEIDLPRIAVIGNQSAGKSSLIEAISGIKVPRESGTCTRCPMEVRLRQTTSSWSCRISLRMKSKDPAAPTIDELFGPTLYAPALVEPMIRKAQLAVLNPSIARSDIANLDEASLERIKKGEKLSKDDLRFTDDLVCIDIAGPQVTDLTFVDLPGIISSSDPKFKADIVLIESLVKEYIKGNCLILCCLTMKDDLENQKAHLMAREFDPEGTRTVGVLTKADTVEDSEHARWFSILRNESSPLHLGYFCIKQPSSADLGSGSLTWEGSRKAEAKFFTQTPPWTELDPQYQKRLGTPALTRFLSTRLSKYIMEKLPELNLKASTAYNRVVTQYDLLPPPPSVDPKSELQQLIYAFVDDLRKLSDGKNVELVQTAMGIYDKFRLQIAATEPMFIALDCSTSSEERRDILNKPREWSDEESALEAEMGAEGAGLLVGSSSSAKRPYSTLQGLQKKSIRLADVLKPRQTADDLYLKMDLDDIRAHVKQAKTRELPLNTPYSAKESLMMDATKAWDQIATYCLDQLHPVVFKLVEAFVGIHFSRFRGGELRRLVSTVVQAGVEEIFTNARKNLLWLLSLEKNPYTSNSHYFSSTAETVKARLTAARGQGQGGALSKEKVAELQAFILEKMPGAKVTEDSLKSLYPSDEYQEEIEVMSQVVAYWKVAYKRITDYVPKALDHDIIRKLYQAVHTTLTKELGGENVVALMKEDEDVTSRRDELEKRKKTLLAAKNMLASFEFGGRENATMKEEEEEEL